MIIHGAHNSDTSDLYKNGKHVSKVIRNGKTIWQSGTYALLHNGAIGKLCKGHIDMVGPSGNVYVRDGSVYAREGADEYRITSTGDWPHGGADGDWPHSGDYLCKMVHTEYATGENWHLYPDEAAKNMVFIQFHGELYSFQCPEETTIRSSTGKRSCTASSTGQSSTSADSPLRKTETCIKSMSIQIIDIPDG